MLELTAWWSKTSRYVGEQGQGDHSPDWGQAAGVRRLDHEDTKVREEHEARRARSTKLGREVRCLDHERTKAREEHEARSSRGECGLQRTPSCSSCFVFFVPFACSRSKRFASSWPKHRRRWPALLSTKHRLSLSDRDRSYVPTREPLTSRDNRRRWL
jgi:hypothetical protein